MAYQPTWVISCHIHPRRRTVIVLFKVSLFEGISTIVGYCCVLGTSGGVTVSKLVVFWLVNTSIYNYKTNHDM